MSKELVPIITPVGEIHWANIKGQGKLKYNKKDEYEYTATLYLSKKEAEPLIEAIDELLEKPPVGCDLKSKGYKELLKDKEGNLYFPNKNGKVIIKVDGEKKDITKECAASGVLAFPFKTGVTFPDGKPKIINVFDSSKPARKVDLGERRIGNGTKGRINGKMKMYSDESEYGATLFLNSIQITSFKAYEGGDAGFDDAAEGDFYGFDDGDSFEDTSEDGASQEQTKAKPRL